MLGQRPDEGIGNIQSNGYSIPVFFIAVISGFYPVVLTSKFNGIIGIAFEIDAVEFENITHRKYFTGYFKDQRAIIKWCTFFSKGKGKTIISETFNVQFHGLFVGRAQLFFTTNYRASFKAQAKLMGVVRTISQFIQRKIICV